MKYPDNTSKTSDIPTIPMRTGITRQPVNAPLQASQHFPLSLNTSLNIRQLL